MFAAMGVPNFDMDDDVAMADECRSREFRRRESSLAEWSSRLDHSESRFACESVNAVRHEPALALDASNDALRQALEEVGTASGAKLRY